MKWLRIFSRGREHQQYLKHVIESNSYLSMSTIFKIAPKASLADLYVPLKALTRDVDDITGSEFEDDFVDWEISEQIIRVVEREAEERIDPLDSLISKESRLVVLGRPGSGKTTFISHLALHTAQNYRGKPSVTSLPLKISLKDLERYLADGSHVTKSQPSLQWILDFLSFYLTSSNLGDYQDTLVASLEQGECLVLFDGLDAVADYDQRVLIREAIEQFIDNYPENHYVVTARPEGYRGKARFGMDFRVCKICDFSVREIEQFIRNLHQYVFTDAVYKGGSPLFASIQSNPYYLALAVNPFLLSAITAVYNELGQLPPYRAELYGHTTNILLADWQLEGDVEQAERARLKKQFLTRVAFNLHREKRQSIDRDEVLKFFVEWVEELKLRETGRRVLIRIYKPDSLSSYETGLGELLYQMGQDHPRYSKALVYEQRLREIIDRIRRYGDTDTRKAERSEIIDQLNELALSTVGTTFNKLCKETPTTTRQEAFESLPVHKSAERLMESMMHCAIFSADGVGRFSFAHRAFQEFFAASYLMESDYDVPFAIEHFHDSWWREVILLLADLLATQSSKRAMALAGALFEQWREQSKSGERQILHPGLFLAGECLALYGNRVFSDDPIYQDIAQELWKRIIDSPVFPLKFEAARLLATLHVTNLREQVLNALDAEEWAVRAASVYAWGFIFHGIKTQQLESGLEELLHLSWSDPQSDVRSCAFNSVLLMAKKPGLIGDATISRLCAVLKDGPSESMRTAANLVGYLANTSQSETLVTALGTVLTKYTERDQATVIWAIGQFDRSFVPKSIIQALWDIALDERKHWLPRSEAILALGNLGRDSLSSRRQKELLNIAIVSKVRRVRSAAALALGQLYTHGLFKSVKGCVRREFKEGSSEERRISCAKVLGRLGSLSLEIPTAINTLSELAINPAWRRAYRLRYEAVKALGRIGAEEDGFGSAYLQVLRDLSEKPGEHHYVRCGATFALSQISQGKLLGKFIAHLIEHILAESPERSELRLAAIRAIDKVKLPSLLRTFSAREELFDMLMLHTKVDKEPSTDVRATAIRVLSKVAERMNSSQVVARFLETFETDPSQTVLREVLQCIGNLRAGPKEQQVMDGLSGLLEDACLDCELQAIAYSVLQKSFEPTLAQRPQPVTLDLRKERRTQVQFYLEQIMGLAPLEQFEEALDFSELMGSGGRAARREVISRFLEVLWEHYQLRAKSEVDPAFGRFWRNESSYGATVLELRVVLENIFQEIMERAYLQREQRRVESGLLPPWRPSRVGRDQVATRAHIIVDEAVIEHFYVRPIPSERTETLKRYLHELRGKVDAMKGRLPAIRGDDWSQFIVFKQDCTAALEQQLEYIRKRVGRSLSVAGHMAIPPGLDECVKMAHREVWKEEINFELLNELLSAIKGTRIGGWTT